MDIILWKSFFIWNKTKIEKFNKDKNLFIDFLIGREKINKEIIEGIKYHQLISYIFKNNLSNLEDVKILNETLKEAVKKIIEFKKSKNLELLVVEKTFQIEIKLEDLGVKKEIINFLIKNYGKDSVIVNGKVDFLFKGETYYILELKLNSYKKDLFYVWLLWKITGLIPVLVTFNIKEGSFIEEKIDEEYLKKLDEERKNTIKEGIEFIYNNKEKIKNTSI